MFKFLKNWVVLSVLLLSNLYILPNSELITLSGLVEPIDGIGGIPILRSGLVKFSLSYLLSKNLATIYYGYENYDSKRILCDYAYLFSLKSIWLFFCITQIGYAVLGYLIPKIFRSNLVGVYNKQFIKDLRDIKRIKQGFLLNRNEILLQKQEKVLFNLFRLVYLSIQLTLGIYAHYLYLNEFGISVFNFIMVTLNYGLYVAVCHIIIIRTGALSYYYAIESLYQKMCLLNRLTIIKEKAKNLASISVLTEEQNEENAILLSRLRSDLVKAKIISQFFANILIYPLLILFGIVLVSIYASVYTKTVIEKILFAIIVIGIKGKTSFTEI